MADSDVRMAILQEMANIRRELATLPAKNPPLGPREFVQKYTEHLKARLAQLEEEVKKHPE